MSHDVILLTDERYVGSVIQSAYNQNVLLEDRLVLEALERRGLNVTKKAWSDPTVDWTATRAALFRSTWDYADRLPAFRGWLQRIAGQTKLINPYELIRWNLDKHYLLDLEAKEVRIVPSYFIAPGDTRSLKTLHKELNWDKTVLKPAISAAAKNTFVITQDTLTQYEAIYAALIQKEGMILQPFQEQVPAQGEVSLMVFGREYTHAVRKIAKPGDFRVQDDFGGTVHAHEPSPEEVELALKAVSACHTLPTYARVDIVIDNEGRYALSELELIEPELWFRRLPDAADVLAQGIAEALKQ